ncbi:MAG TPA: methionine synthase [Streptosporangiaceae bacterium]|nr:methionine synthase [Streptosporangiaceae bacterium]
MPETTSEQPFPWPVGCASGVGSLPGADPAEAVRLVFGELPDLPYLAELPARGPGADLTGRTAALLVDLPVETTPGGWRFAARPGRDLGRARAMLSADLDALEEVASGYQGPLKVQVCGPWTLAATIGLLRSQDPALADPGAVADLTDSLAEGAAAHVADVSKRVPGAVVLLQVDEPAISSVLRGMVPTASGLNRLPAPEAPAAAAGLRRVLSVSPAYSVVHCCAASVPFGIIKDAGADAVGFDLSQVSPGAEEALAETAEAGLGIFAGAVAVPRSPGSAWAAPAPSAVARRVTGLWQRMGWPVSRSAGAAAGRADVAGQVVLTPACGLASASPAQAKAAMAGCREAARLLPELIEEERP